MGNLYRVVGRFQNSHMKVVILNGKLAVRELDFAPPHPIPGLPDNMDPQQRVLAEGLFTFYENAVIIGAVASNTFKLVDLKVEKV